MSEANETASTRLGVHRIVRRLRSEACGHSSIAECNQLKADSADVIESLLSMLERFAVRGEELWDRENFRDGYKKVPSGDLVDCRKLIEFCECDECGGPMRPDQLNVLMKCQSCGYVLASG
jgi:hypothetical protein